MDLTIFEPQGSPVGDDERLRPFLPGEAFHFPKDVPGGVLVDLGVRAVAQDVLTAEDLEEVELQVGEVRAVVGHDRPFF